MNSLKPPLEEDTCNIRTFQSIEEIDRDNWNSISSPANPYHSWEFLKAVELGRQETTKLYYVTFSRSSGELLATTVLSVFETRLFGPRIRISACGLPFPGGQYNFAIREGLDPTQFHTWVVRELERLSYTHKTHLSLVKELTGSHLAVSDIYQRSGFILAPSLPFHRFDITWPTFHSYSESLKCRYRRDVNSALRSMGTKIPELFTAESYDDTDNLPRFVIGGREVCTAREFYHLYCNIAHRARLKTFQQEQLKFFEELYKLAGLTILTIKHHGRTNIAALLLQRDKYLIGVFVGKSDTPDDTFNLYPNLIHGAIQLAIKRGCTALLLGQTTDEPKLRRGSTAEKRYFLIRARNRWINALLHRFQSKLFQEHPLPNVSAYHREC